MEEVPALAVIAYSRAIDFEDRGELDAALEQYEAALAAYPGYRSAERAIERLRGASDPGVELGERAPR